jgi:acetate CoA/acetoacetate CoA-transferase beta subunit
VSLKNLKDGDVVNLGIGLPTMVANFIAPGIDVTFQSENGMLGLGPAPKDEMKIGILPMQVADLSR